MGMQLLDDSLNMTSNSVGCNARLKWYGDTCKIVLFDRPIYGQRPLVSDGKRAPAARDRNDNLRRAMTKVFDIVYANKWEWWVTLTLDPEKIDRLDVNAITNVARRWLSNLVQRQGVKYCMVLEYHANREGIHMHALMTGDIADRMVDSGHKQRGHKVYNFDRWGLGYTAAIRVYKQGERLAGYLTKYMLKQPDKIAGRWYWSGGKGLVREVPTEYCMMDYEHAQGKAYDVPGTSLHVKYLTVKGG